MKRFLQIAFAAVMMSASACLFSGCYQDVTLDLRGKETTLPVDDDDNDDSIGDDLVVDNDSTPNAEVDDDDETAEDDDGLCMLPPWTVTCLFTGSPDGQIPVFDCYPLAEDGSDSVYDDIENSEATTKCFKGYPEVMICPGVLIFGDEASCFVGADFDQVYRCVSSWFDLIHGVAQCQRE